MIPPASGPRTESPASGQRGCRRVEGVTLVPLAPLEPEVPYRFSDSRYSGIMFHVKEYVQVGELSTQVFFQVP